MDTTDTSLTNPETLVPRVETATEVIEWLAADWGLLDRLPAALRRRLHRAVAGLHTPDPAARRTRVRSARRLRKAADARREDAVLDRTGIRALRRRPMFTAPGTFAPSTPAPEPAPLRRARGECASDARARCCYICKEPFVEIHHFYDQLCPPCAALNFAKRSELADLRGRVALITGGRVKIGYQAGLKLLRAGARLVVTTRFPRNAVSRYTREQDFADWRERLEIVGLDLRHTPSVEAFCSQFAAASPRLDFILNNACQTVRRPPAFYAHMIAEETAALQAGPDPLCRMTDASGAIDSARLSQVPLVPADRAAHAGLFPDGLLDQDLQQIDLRERNSWRLLLHEVSTVELLEVQLVNAVAPFIINARLKPLMVRTPGRDKHIINVSAVEGQFYRRFKTTRHPHTNMAKAALNMMTRTAAADYFHDGIHMNSVDTGWVTDEDPAEIAARKTVEQRFHPPLDAVDGAARIVDPIVSGVNTGTHVWGKFLKDYRPTDW